MRYWYRTLRTACRALLRNPMITALATLGIVIGVAAVIAMVEIGQGSKKAVEATILSMGANNLLIQPGTASSGGVSFGSGSIMTLTPADAEAIARECQPAVSSVAPIVRARTQVIYQNHNWVPLYIYGTTGDYLDVREWEIADGRIWTDQEANGGAEVCVLGQTLARELFGSESPINKMVRMNEHGLKVVGVLERKGANMMGLDQDDIVLAPWRTIKFKISGQSAQTTNQSQSTTSTDPTQTATTSASSSNARYPNMQANIYPAKSASQLQNYPQPLLPTNVDQILVRAASEPQIKEAIRQITALLHERHKIRSGQPDDFNIRDMTEISKAMGSSTEVMSVWLKGVSAIALIVGGVGIMTIMLVSVTERTKEIGLRMAVGARAKDILRQFLVEAILLCVVGGAVGIVLGRGGSILMRSIFHLRTELSIPAILAAVGVSVVVGVVFGYYPAWKASRLDPIEALRYE